MAWKGKAVVESPVTQSETASRVWHCLTHAVDDPQRLQGVDESTHLFDEAVLDSAATAQMFSQLEQEFGIKLTDDDLFDDAFATLKGIAALVDKRAGT